MTARIHIAVVLLATIMCLAIRPALGAEATEEMRLFARLFATLETRDRNGYCQAMDGPAYVGYLSRVCRAAVQNRMKQPEDCGEETIAKQAKLDNAQCLAMPAAELEKTALRGVDASTAFVKELAAQGVDGEQLLQDERVKLLQEQRQVYELLKACCARPVQGDQDERARAARLEREHALLETGASVLDKESEHVKTAAAHAVSAQSAATRADLRLLSITDARSIALAKPHYSLSLVVLKDARPQSASARVERQPDGTYQLLRWSWRNELNDAQIEEQQRRAFRERLR